MWLTDARHELWPIPSAHLRSTGEQSLVRLSLTQSKLCSCVASELVSGSAGKSSAPEPTRQETTNSCKRSSDPAMFTIFSRAAQSCWLTTVQQISRTVSPHACLNTSPLTAPPFSPAFSLQNHCSILAALCSIWFSEMNTIVNSLCCFAT